MAIAALGAVLSKPKDVVPNFIEGGPLVSQRREYQRAQALADTPEVIKAIHQGNVGVDRSASVADLDTSHAAGLDLLGIDAQNGGQTLAVAADTPSPGGGKRLKFHATDQVAQVNALETFVLGPTQNLAQGVGFGFIHGAGQSFFL